MRPPMPTHPAPRTKPPGRGRRGARLTRLAPRASLGLVGLDVEDDVHIVAEQRAAGVERLVPDDAVVLAVDGRGGLETRLVAHLLATHPERTGADELRVEHHLLGDA